MNIGTLTIEMAANVARLSKDMDAARRTVERTFGSIEKDVARLKDLLGGLFAGLSASAFVGKLVEVQRQFDVLNSSLITVTGSSAAAAREFAWIKQFAATTPFQLAEVTSAFVKMKALGLDASQAALTSYGNTASAMGKSLNQMIEAVADAATGEFERLKEFGIKAKQQGDQVTLTFQGVSKTIGNNAAEITAYLQAIGENEFAGAMAQRAQTLDGAISNLADTWDELFRTISQQPAGGLIYDSVKLASGAIEDMITILNALNGATAENAKQTGAMKVIQEGIAIVFETVAVLGVNLKYVLVQIGREIGGIAAQAEQYVRGGQAVGILFDVLTKGYSEEWNAIKAIRAEMVKDAEAARREVDATTERILNARRLAEQARRSLQGVDTRAEDARLARYAEQAEGVRKVGAAAADTKKKVKDLGDEFASQREAAKAWADAYQDFARIAASATAESLGLSKAQARLVEFLSSPAYANASEPMRQLALEQAYAAVTAEQNAAAQKEQAKALEAAAKAEADRIEALERGTASAKEQLQRLLDEEKALTIAAEKNITLAQAIEEVAIARLREQQAALMAEGDRDAEVLAIQREIDARKKLAEAIGRKEARDAAADSAKEAAREWQRTAESIERSLTDALLRGFESGKDFARNLRDTVVNMFNTMVLRPVIQAVVAPVAGGITGALGLPGTANAAQGGIGGASGVLSGLSGLGSALGVGLGAGFSSIAAAGIGGWLSAGTSLIGTGTLAGIGAGLGLLAGPIGWVLAIGGLLSSLFGDDDPRYKFLTNSSNTNPGKLFEDGVFVKSAYGNIGFDDYAKNIDANKFQETFQAIAQLDNAIAATLSPSENDRIRQALDGYVSGKDEATVDYVANRLRIITDTVGGAIDQLADQFDGTSEEFVDYASRLVQARSLIPALQDLGVALDGSSAVAAQLALTLSDAFGGAQNAAQALAGYFQNYYTEAERVEVATQRLREAFAAIGVEMPATREAFRALVEAQDLTTASGREMFSQLVQLGPAFAGLTNKMQQRLNDFANEAKRLEAQLLEAQGDAEGAKEAMRALAIEGLTELEIAAYDANEALRAQIQLLQERSSLEQRLLQLRGDTAALRARELASVDASNRAILERIYAIEDARAATDAAYSALERAIDAQRTSIMAMRDAAQEQVDSITAVFDVLTSNIEDLYNEATSTSTMSAAAGQAFIAQALATARSTGYLPDSRELEQAIRAARGGLSSGRYTSAFEAKRDRLVLAGRLSQLREISGNQLTTAEQQLKVAEQQLESLDGQLATARAQLDAMRGVDQRVLSVEQAIRELNAAMAAELRALGGALAASKAFSAPPVESLSSPSAAAAAGYITSPVNEYGSYTGIGDSGYRLQVTSSGATLYFPGGGSHTVSGPTAAQLLTDAYGLTPGGLNGTLMRTRAQGGYTPPGLTLVGEEGPELVNFRNPGMVYTAAQTSNLLQGDNSELINEVRQLREENRAQARAMVQLQARVTRLLERWDGDGMPETRSVTA